MKSTKRNSRINASALMRNELPPVKQFDKAEFAKRLCYTRELAQFPTQQDFAAAIGTVKQTINHYETGERLPNAEVLFKMADCLGCSVDWLLGISDNLHPDNKYIEDVTGLNESAIEFLSECGYTKKCFPDKHLIFNLLLSNMYINVLVDSIQEIVESITQLAYPQENIPLQRRRRALQELEESGAHPAIIEAERESIELEERIVNNSRRIELSEQVELCRFRFSKAMGTFLDETAAALSKDYGEWLLCQKRRELSDVESNIEYAKWVSDNGINET